MYFFFRLDIQKAKKYHDELFSKIDFETIIHPDFVKEKTNEIPYFSSESTSKNEKIRMAQLNAFDTIRFYENLLPKGATWLDNDINVRMNLFLRRRMQKLCKGTVRFLCNSLYSLLKPRISEFLFMKHNEFRNPTFTCSMPKNRISRPKIIHTHIH